MIHSADRAIHGLNTNEVKSADTLMLSQFSYDWWIMNVHGYSLASTCFQNNHRPQRGEGTYLSVFVRETILVAKCSRMYDTLEKGWEVIVIGKERKRVKNWPFTEVP